MKKIISYVAYDDTEFEKEEDCLRYEETAREYIKQFEETYTFYTNDFNPYIPPIEYDILDYIIWLEEVYSKCDVVHVKKLPNEDMSDFIYYNAGIGLPKKGEVGWFAYDYKIPDWVRIERDE